MTLDAAALQVLIARLTGIATEICVLFTAADAHMRDYRLWVPEDAVASVEEAQGKAALAMMQSSMGAETANTRALSLATWIAQESAADE